MSKKVYTEVIGKTTEGNWLSAVSQLIKLRLTLVVVFSSVLAYLIAAQGAIQWMNMLILGVGGLLITSASNILNEVLERDFDGQMKRTMNRPLVTGRINISLGVLIAGIAACSGMFLLALLHPVAALLGSLALVSYAFIYTPLKRFSLWAVPVGAVPGAMPVLIGAVVAEGGITMLGITLFAIQFLWQFPHFWAIGWLGFDDYKKAGFAFIPEKNGSVDPRLGWHSALYALLLIPVVLTPSYLGITHIAAGVFLVAITCVFAWLGWNLYIRRTRREALVLMFGSLLYLPVVLSIIWLA